MKTWSIKRLALCGIIAGVYAVLTIVTAPIAYGTIQLRLAEAMCIFPFFAPYTMWGLVLGCLLSNLFSPVTALDLIVGTGATLLAGAFTAHCRHFWAAWIPPVVCNMILIGALLSAVYLPGQHFWKGFLLFGFEVGVGEAIVQVFFGLPLGMLLRRRGWDAILRDL